MHKGEKNLVICTRVLAKLNNNSSTRYKINTEDFRRLLGSNGVEALPAKRFSAELNARLEWNVKGFIKQEVLAPSTSLMYKNEQGDASLRFGNDKYIGDNRSESTEDCEEEQEEPIRMAVEIEEIEEIEECIKLITREDTQEILDLEEQLEFLKEQSRSGWGNLQLEEQIRNKINKLRNPEENQEAKQVKIVDEKEEIKMNNSQGSITSDNFRTVPPRDTPMESGLQAPTPSRRTIGYSPIRENTNFQDQAMRTVENMVILKWDYIEQFSNDFMYFVGQTGKPYDEELSNKYLRKLPGELGKEIERKWYSLNYP